jgi:hypothetical protein
VGSAVGDFGLGVGVGGEVISGVVGWKLWVVSYGL